MLSCYVLLSVFYVLHCTNIYPIFFFFLVWGGRLGLQILALCTWDVVIICGCVLAFLSENEVFKESFFSPFGFCSIKNGS